MTDGPHAANARREAARLVASLRRAQPALVELEGIDLGPALEQQLFFALRDGGRAGYPGSRVALTAAGLARLAAAGGAAAVAILRDRAAARGGGLVALVRAVSHLPILDRIDAELVAAGAEPTFRVRVGAAAGERAARGEARLSHLLAVRHLPAVVRHHALVEARGSRVAAVDSRLAGVVRRELPRIALGAWGLASVVQRLQPTLLMCFDEKGTWARLLPAAARRYAIPSVDLPHAETGDPVAIVGAGYDRMAVFGPAGREVLLAAGIEPGRIVETGAPHFDALVSAPPSSAAAGDARPRVVLAAQYPTGAMTSEVLHAVFRGAASAAAAVGPSLLLVRPHPAEPRGTAARMLARLERPAGVEVRLDEETPLHRLLDDAWLLVTGWSNSLFEAALRGVPCLMVAPGGVVPVPYAAEGMALLAPDERAAADAARSLRDPEARRAAVERARAGLERHLGPLDGAAGRRTARLLLELSGGRRAEGTR